MGGEARTIEVVYALPDRQRLVRLAVESGTTARSAALGSGLDQEFSELDLAACALGVFGRRVADDYELQSGDRLELYRPLRNEPREARRRRAAKGRTKNTGDAPRGS